MYASDLKHENASLEDKLHQLYRLNRDKTVDLGFRPPYLRLLEAFGNPHLSLPPVIHVAGTNGKGSTIAFMRAILEAAGYNVHTYTSPHLVRFNERIVLAGKQISDEALEALVDEAIKLNNGGDVTFFEITTAMAFATFSRIPADIILLEVGLGGRLDCTNIIKTAAASVINTVSYDHMEFLGENLPEIVAEKAGIMKSNAPCIVGAQKDQAWATLESTADSKGVTLFRYGSGWSIEDQGVHICFKSGAETHILPKPALTGLHQIKNAGLAIATLKILESQSHFRFTEESLKNGLKKTTWPARLQKLPSPNEEHELWLDGGHNEDAGRAIAAQAKLWQENDNKPLHLVLGMMAHKDVKTFLKPVLPFVTSLTIIAIPGEPDSMGVETLNEQIKGLSTNLEIEHAPNWQAGCQKINEQHKEQKRILVAGSLYLAGHVLKDIEDSSHNAH